MKKTFTILIAAIAAILMMAQPTKAWADVVTFDASKDVTGSTNTNSYTTGPTTFNCDDGSTWKAAGYQQTQYTWIGPGKGGANYLETPSVNGTISSVTVTWSGNESYYLALQTTSGTELEAKSNPSSSSTATYTVSGTYSQLRLVGRRSASGNALAKIEKVVVTYTPSGGNTPSLSVNPSSVAFGDNNTINPQTAYSRTFSVTFANLTQDLTVSVPSSLSNAGVSVNPTSISKTANSPQTVTVSFNPGDEVTLSGNITVSNTANNLSQTVAVTGSAYDPSSIVYYQQIATSQSDWTGKYIFTGYYTSGSKYQAFSSMNSGNYGNIQDVATTTNGIQSTTTIDGYALTVLYTRTVNNVKQYSIQMSDGKYLYYTGSSNALYAKETFTAGDCEWTLTYSNGKVSIKNVGTTSRYLQYNANSRFACYQSSSNQSDLYLFKYQGDVVLPLSLPFVSLEAGDQTITPTWSAVANADHYALQWSTSATFASDVHDVNPATSGTAISGLTNGTSYYVRVKAIGAGEDPNTSDWSAIVSETPSAATIPTPEIECFEGLSTGTANEYVAIASFKFTIEDHDDYTLYYTLDDSDPTTSQTAVEYTYDEEVVIDETATIKVVATDGNSFSDVAELDVTILPITPISTVFAAQDNNNKYYCIEGIMTYKQSNNNRFVEDETAGILVYGSNNNIAVGDRLIIKGTKTTYNGKPELQNITLVSTVSHDNTLPCHEINISQASDYMHRRVKYTQVLVGATSSNVTSISQGNNTIGVYNMPSVTNVTDEGYYLKSITGVVGYYNTTSTNQMYVVSDDIVPYTINASSNNTTLGTVATSGYVVTATPAASIGYANPAYDLETDATDYDVQQEGNIFTIVTNGDMEIEIQFAAAASYTISYTTNGTAEQATTQVLQSSGKISELIEPTAANIPNGYTFMGWTTSAISGVQDNEPTFVEVGDDIDDDMDLIAVFAIDKITSTTYDKVAANTSNIVNGTYLIAVNKVNSNNYNFANASISSGKAGVEATGVATASSYSPSNIPSGAKEYTLSGDNTNGFLIHCSSGYLDATSNAGSLSYNNANNAANNSEKWIFSVKDQGFVLTGASGGTKTSCNSSTASTAIRNYASNGSYYDPLFFFKKNETHEYYNYCTSVSAIEDDDLPINNDNELTESFTISGVNYLDTYIIVPDGITLTVDGTLGNSDPDLLVIEDGGRLIVYNEGVQATVKKGIEGVGDENWSATSGAEGWYFIASPVNGASFSTATTGDYDLYMLDWENEQWLNQKNNENSALFANGFQRGTGYLYANKEDLHDDNQLSFAGEIQPLNNEDKATVTLAVDGWNLIGNPLTCKVTVDKAFSVLNDERSGLINQDEGSAINPCQGIAVYGDADDVVTFTKAESQTAAAPSNSASLQMTLAKSVTTRGTVSSKVVDNAIVNFEGNSTLPKFTMIEGDAKLFIPQNGEDYAIAFSNRQGDMPLNFKAKELGTYTISFEGEEMDLNGIYLIDMLDEEEIDLSVNPSYTFIGSPADRSARFKIVFKNNGNDSTSDIFAYQSGSDIVVSGEGELQIFDVMGRMVARHNVNGVQTINAMAHGVYIFKLNEKTQKIIVK